MDEKIDENVHLQFGNIEKMKDSRIVIGYSESSVLKVIQWINRGKGGGFIQ